MDMATAEVGAVTLQEPHVFVGENEDGVIWPV